MVFKASLDNTSKFITFFVTAFLVMIIAGQIIVSGFAIAICITAYLFSFLFRPINYKVNNNQLIVHRLLKDVIIPDHQIKNIELLDSLRLSTTMRLFGVGGLFGYYGIFKNSTIGKMTWYATRHNNAVLVETTSGKNIILTPDEPTAFLAAMANRKKE